MSITEAPRITTPFTAKSELVTATAVQAALAVSTMLPLIASIVR